MAEIGIKQIQLLALAAIEDPDWDAQYRDICRWYSKEFHTPLSQVEMDLDQLHVLRHYYEYTFKTLRDSDSESSQMRYEELKQSLIYGKETEEIEKIREEEDDEWERQMLKEIRQNQKELEEKENRAESDEPPAAAESVNELNNPNIEGDVEYTVQGEDGPPEF